MVDRENVNDLIRENGFAGEVDFLSIDVDGSDYWIWEAIEACSPRIVAIEYNSLLGPDRALVVPYEPDFDRHSGRGSIYYGASLAAMVRLGKEKGFRLVVTEPRGVNAFFLRDGVAPEIPELSPQEGFTQPYELVRRGIDLFRHVDENQLPLVDLDALPARP